MLGKSQARLLRARGEESGRATIMDAAQADLTIGVCVNYFWFGDCCWRHPKLSFKQQDELLLRRRLY